MKLSKNEAIVAAYLKGFDEFMSPTEIAQKLMSSAHHSAWASPICLRLVKKGLLERNKKGHYRYKEPK